LRSIDARKDFVFWSTADACACRLRRPDCPRETERSPAPDLRQELLPSAVIASHARKSLSVIEFRQVRRQPVSAFNSCVNSAPQRKIVSPQWDSRARPAKRQHHRCIGCETTLLSFLGPSVGFSLRFVSCVGAALGCFKPRLPETDVWTASTVQQPMISSASRRTGEPRLAPRPSRKMVSVSPHASYVCRR
jgi:hypothetical protein